MTGWWSRIAEFFRIGPPQHGEWIVNGLRYDTRTATLLASSIGGGRPGERLYQTPNGRFFIAWHDSPSDSSWAMFMMELTRQEAEKKFEQGYQHVPYHEFMGKPIKEA